MTDKRKNNLMKQFSSPEHAVDVRRQTKRLRGEIHAGMKNLENRIITVHILLVNKFGCMVKFFLIE